MVLALTAALAACSAYNGMPPVTSGVAQMATSQRAVASASVSVAVHWTQSKSKAALNHGRRPQFLSPSAQSVEITVVPAVGSGKRLKAITKIVNKPNPVTSPTVVTFDVPAGNHDFIFGDYDKPNATGNQLGGADIIDDVVAGRSNHVGLTLDGYVAGVKLSSSNAWLLEGHDEGGQPSYTLVGEAPVDVSMALLDADGNVIVPASAAGAAKLTSTDPSISVKPVPAHSLTYTIHAVAANASVHFVNGALVPSPIALQANVSSGNGAQNYQTSFTITQLGVVYASYHASATSAKMAVFDQFGRSYTSSGGFPGLDDPVAAAWDEVDQALLIADAGTGKVFAYDANGNPLAGFNPPSVPGVTSVTYSPFTHRIYASAAVAAGAPADAIFAFDRRGTPQVLAGFADLDDPISISYGNNLYNVGNTYVDLLVANKPSTGPALMTAFYASGGEVGGFPLSMGTFTPTAFYVRSGELVGTIDGKATWAEYNGTDFVVNPFKASFKITKPVAAAMAPLAFCDHPYACNKLDSIWSYFANATGNIEVLSYGEGTHDTNYTFSPPPGASGFATVVVTY